MTEKFQAFATSHGPQEQADYTFVFRLAPGEAITSAQVTVVDSTSMQPDLSTDLMIRSTSYGQMNASNWGVTIWVMGGSTKPDGSTKNYYVRCAIVTNSTPYPRRINRTLRLRVVHQ